METNEIKIDVPEGYEIDKENSTFECIKFKKKEKFEDGDVVVIETECYTMTGLYKHENKIFVYIHVGYVRGTINENYLCSSMVNKKFIQNIHKADEEVKRNFSEWLNSVGYEWNAETKTILEKDELPKTWEEFCENNPIKIGEAWFNGFSKIRVEEPSDIRARLAIEDKNLLPSKELAEAMLALCQLIQLRDCYNDGWNPDYSTNEDKYNIISIGNQVVKDKAFSVQHVLVFKSEKLCDKFMDNFRDLLEIAKPLL